MERAPAHSVVGKRFSSSGGDKGRGRHFRADSLVWLEGYPGAPPVAGPERDLSKMSRVP